MSRVPSPTLPHLRQLDGVRAIAVLIVFFAHCGLENIVPGGFGVTVFFFLSGYLITSLMRGEAAATGRVDLPAFYVRRTLRIWPPLYLTMAFVWACCLVIAPGAEIDPWGVAAQALFVTNYAGLWGHGGGLPNMPLWSLAVEEHFYLLFPLMFAAFLIRRTPAQAARWCFGACGLVLLIRCVSAATLEHIDYIYYFSHTRVDSILWGCCLALWNNPAMDEGAWRPRRWHVVVAFAVLLFNLLYRDEVFRETLRYSLQGAALFVIFSFVLWNEGRVARMLSGRAMRLVGLYSYTFYLVHMTMIALTVWLWPRIPIAGTIVVAGAATMLYCAAMYRYVERPMALMRRRLHEKDRQGAAVPV